MLPTYLPQIAKRYDLPSMTSKSSFIMKVYHNDKHTMVEAIRCTLPLSQGGHTFERINSLGIPGERRGYFQISLKQLKREKFPEIHFYWQFCHICHIFLEFYLFSIKSSESSEISLRFFTIFQIP